MPILGLNSMYPFPSFICVPYLTVVCRGLVPGTDESYEDYCRNFKVKPRFEILEDGTRAYWMGSKTARNVMLYLHGWSLSTVTSGDSYPC